MKNCKLLVLLLSVCIACHATLQSGNAHFIVKNLKTEYAVTPLGLDVELPRFSLLDWNKEKNICCLVLKIPSWLFPAR